MQINDIRQAWLDYYSNLGYSVIPGAPLVHPAFPLSFNMSAGLIQLDPQIRSKTPTPPRKQCLIQPCFRYFDLDKIGDDSHLSFFEMTGAFEIRIFDKAETIEKLWIFLTEILKIDKTKICLTFFDKDIVANREISLPENLKRKCLSLVNQERLFLGNNENTLWKQGGGAVFHDNLRLCGPQVEFWFDLGEKNCCQKEKCSPLQNCGRFLEIGNIIFIKYGIDSNQEPKLINLINQSTEAVIGLERVSRVTEKAQNIFETSAFFPLIKLIGNDSKNHEARIICDHIKSLTFILNKDIIFPGKNGREKIVRTLLRQLLTSMLVLKLEVEKIIPKLIDEVIKIYSSDYPEIAKNKTKTANFIVNYYQKVFRISLEKGIRRISAHLEKNKIDKITPILQEKFKIDFGVPVSLQPKHNIL